MRTFRNKLQSTLERPSRYCAIMHVSYAIYLVMRIALVCLHRVLNDTVNTDRIRSYIKYTILYIFKHFLLKIIDKINQKLYIKIFQTVLIELFVDFHKLKYIIK